MHAGHLRNNTHTCIYLYARALSLFSKRTPTHVLIIFSSHQCVSYQLRRTSPSKASQHINTLNPHTFSPSPQFSPYLFFLPAAFIEDQTNSRYLHPLGLSSHSTAVLWYRRAGKGTRLLLSGSLREHCVRLDRYLSSNVPQERPTCPLGDWCTEGDKRDIGGGISWKIVP